jgi:hypothetical protein
MSTFKAQRRGRTYGTLIALVVGLAAAGLSLPYVVGEPAAPPPNTVLR